MSVVCSKERGLNRKKAIKRALKVFPEEGDVQKRFVFQLRAE